MRGSDAAQGTGPDETLINYINIDERAPSDCLLVKTDSNHTGMYDPMTGEITTDVIHSVKEDEVVRVMWSTGSRSGVNVTAVDETTITISGGTSGDALPGSPTEMTVVRYSATSTIVGAAHVHGTRASQSRGNAIYVSVGSDFDASPRSISGLSAVDLSALALGDYVEMYDEMGAAPGYPVFVGKIAVISDDPMDINDSIRLETDVFYGTLPSTSNNRWKIVVYRPSNEKPIFSFKNTYGYHRINNLRLGYGRMVRAQGGSSTHPVRTIFDGVLFCGRSRDVNGTAYGPTWLYDENCVTTDEAASRAARAIAMLYTTDSSGWVVGEITAAYEEPNGFDHGGKRYQSFSWRGELNGAGAFTQVSVTVW